MEDDLMTEGEAAVFCQLKLTYFKNLRRAGRGPTFVRPSPKITMYFKSDVETWKASWATVGSAKNSIS
jgi:hypothetical protein